MSRTILVATDGSPTAQDAITFAVDLAAEHDWKVVFVHVIPLLDFAPTFGLGEVSAAWPHEPTARDHELLEQAVELAADRGVASTTALLGGPTAEEIIAHADSCDADMIVVGSHGHRRLARIILGSVSLGVLAGTKRPVLIVRGTGPFLDESDVARLPG